MHTRTILLLTLIATIAAAGCGSSGRSPSAPSPAPTTNTAGSTQVSIVSGATGMTTTAYAPNPIAVSVGATVTWTNNDTITHTATSNDGTWNSGNVAPGGNFSRTFSTAGTFPYHCAIHPGMVGTVTVQ